MRQYGLRLILLLVVQLMAANVTTMADTTSVKILTNEYCPVTTTEKADPNIFVDFEGQRIHFCCQKCKRDFVADPDKYLENLQLSEVGPVSDKLAHYRQVSGQSASETPSTDDHHSHRHQGINSDSAASVQSGLQPHDDDASDEPASHQHEDNETVGHNHATDHGNGSKWIAFLGKFHPVMIHFPIALVIMAAIFLATRLVLGITVFDQMTAITMYWAAFFAITAALLGLARGAGANYPSFLVSYFDWHRVLGLTSAGLTTVTAVVGYFWRRGGTRATMIFFRVLLLINVVLIGITGHLGATLVYGPGYFNL